MNGTDIAVAVINGCVAVAVAYTVKQNYDIRSAADTNTNLNRETLSTVRTVELRTNGELEQKIRKAVVEVFAEHRGDVTEAVMAESVRHLLNALLNERRPDNG
jgi:hypothetical protein